MSLLAERIRRHLVAMSPEQYAFAAALDLEISQIVREQVAAENMKGSLSNLRERDLDRISNDPRYDPE